MVQPSGELHGDGEELIGRHHSQNGRWTGRIREYLLAGEVEATSPRTLQAYAQTLRMFRRVCGEAGAGPDSRAVSRSGAKSSSVVGDERRVGKGHGASSS